MSTRANIIIKDETATLYVYRHSDGYPECTGADLKEFVADYESGAMRTNVQQSAGWLFVRGHYEYKSPVLSPRPDPSDRFSGWKCGAYEPTTQLHGDAEYIYIIDLVKRTLTCRVPKGNGFWDNPTLEATKACSKFKTVRF